MLSIDQSINQISLHMVNWQCLFSEHRYSIYRSLITPQNDKALIASLGLQNGRFKMKRKWLPADQKQVNRVLPVWIGLEILECMGCWRQVKRQVMYIESMWCMDYILYCTIQYVQLLLFLFISAVSIKLFESDKYDLQLTIFSSNCATRFCLIVTKCILSQC